MAMLPFNMVSPEEYLGEADFPGNGIKGEALWIMASSKFLLDSVSFPW